MDDASQAVPGHPFRTLLRLNRPYWKRYAIGAALSLVFSVSELAQPLIIRSLVMRFETGDMTRNLLLLFFGAMLLASMVAGIARYNQRMLMIGASRDFEYDLRNLIFRHVSMLSHRFFNRTKTGDLMARATNDLNYVREFVGPGIMGTVDMIQIPFTLGVMLWLSTKLTLTALIPLPFISILVYVFMRLLNKQSKIAQELFAEVTSRAQENLAGARVVKAYGLADRERKVFEKDSEKYMKANIRLVAIMSFAWPLIGILVGVILLLVIWRGGAMVIQGELSLANMASFLVCMVILAWPMAQLGWVLTLYQRGAVGMNRIAGILAEIPEIQDGPTTNPNAHIEEGEIVFDNVSFRHGDTTVIDNLSFTVAGGETVAVVGPTGAGKSTVVALLTRLYDPNEGEIRLDGQALPTIPLARLHDGMGVVPQDAFIFSESIRNNILIGKPDATEAEIRLACDGAQFTEALERMPQGLDTLLGERGINLSGGQKQRLTIARALIRDPKILILDDALSSVDTHTEEQILVHLKEIMANRTSIIISHRISTLRHADRILVLNEGRLCEEGTHDELINVHGLYADMHHRQLLESALEEAP